MNSYPTDRADGFFALKFCKLLSKTAAANDLGSDAVVLLMIIALKEDSKQYTDAPNYWNNQLMPLCGIGSKKRLVTARNKAIEAGWLHYEQGGKGKVGRYWVLVPGRFETLFGKRYASDLSFRIGTQSGTTNAENDICSSDSEPKADPKRNDKGVTSLPVPKPIPKGNRSFYSDDFEAFWKAFPNGRKTGKKGAFAAWKKAIKDAEPQTIIAAATDYAASDVGQGQYVKGPASWLNQGCWDDDRDAWKEKRPALPNGKSEPEYPNLLDAEREGRLV
jgi:hypothetical protein